MMMSMNEKKILFAFGCPKRELTIARLRHAAALAVDPTAKKDFFSLAIKLNEDATDDWYRNFFYNMRLEVEHKSVGNIKRGYKDHIIVDEDSEIILASTQTPFNTGDEKKLQELIEKVEQDLEIKPEEITADKAYGTADNRAYLMDSEITSNIAFYKDSSREQNYYGLKDFNISGDLSSVTCPNGITTIEYVMTNNKTNNKEFKVFKFDKAECSKCPLKDQCLYKSKNGKLLHKGRRLEVPLRYDAVLRDLKRNDTQEFEEASNKRFKVERRFATMVRNHGLRRCRYLRLKGAKIHIILANMVCNIVRMVNLICPPSTAMPEM